MAVRLDRALAEVEDGDGVTLRYRRDWWVLAITVFFRTRFLANANAIVTSLGHKWLYPLLLDCLTCRLHEGRNCGVYC